MKHLAFTDAATGLPNRVRFDDRRVQAIARAERDQWVLAPLHFDLDLLTAINGTPGHAAKIVRSGCSRTIGMPRRCAAMAVTGACLG